MPLHSVNFQSYEQAQTNQKLESLKNAVLSLLDRSPNNKIERASLLNLILFHIKNDFNLNYSFKELTAWGPYDNQIEIDLDYLCGLIYFEQKSKQNKIFAVYTITKQGQKDAKKIVLTDSQENKITKITDILKKYREPQDIEPVCRKLNQVLKK